MKVLVFGSTGQVARALSALADDALVVETLSRQQADLSDPAACAEKIALTDADVVINAAAWTAVDAAETNADVAFRINADAPAQMARACGLRGLPFVHISTDYVLPGTGMEPQDEDTPVAPLSVYGHTKEAGEAGVRAAMKQTGGRAVILRTSWVFDGQGANFVRTMLRLAQTRDALSVVDDQIGGPTPAGDIAAACITIARALQGGAKGGTVHFSGAPDVSWAQFSQVIFAEAGHSITVTPQPSSDYPTPAHRPLNSRLDCQRIRALYGISRPDWRAALRDIVPQIQADLDEPQQ